MVEERLGEAKLLLAEGRASGAYYLAGYAIECALKARIAAGFQAGEIPRLAHVQRIHTHDLTALLRLAGLDADLVADMEANPVMQRRWTTIAKWSEQARYEIWTIEAAQAILEAVDADGEGLFRWLKNRW